MIFWTLMFPLVLATFFHFAFSNIGESEKFKKIDIAIIDNTALNENIHFKETMDTLAKEENLFKIKYVKNKKEADALLEENKIKGYIEGKPELLVTTKQNGITSTILKTVIDTYYSKISMIENISTEKLTALQMEALNKNTETAYSFKEDANQNMDFTVGFFYTLIGMVCMYAGFFGIDAVNETEANLSSRGARTSISPVHKGKVLLVFLLVGWGLQYVENLVLLAYMIFVLGVDFGSHIGLILLLMFVGSFAGITFGTLIGAISKKSVEIKIPIFITIDLLFSFLAGMMAWRMKYIIATNLPILGAINPVTMITDALYSLYYYSTFTLYYEMIFHLFLFGLVCLTGSYFFIRRKKYDSI